MKIFGIFRGFPGLGRVVSGVSILETLRNEGYEVKAYSYLQGKDVLEDYQLKTIIEKEPSIPHIMVIGLNPISKEMGELIDKIVKEQPDLIIIDGEPLLISTLSYVFPREKIISFLNPTDIENLTLPFSTIIFYRKHYLSAKNVFVHGIGVPDFSRLESEYSCNIKSINTILRNEILELKGQIVGEKIIGILGGGCSNASKNFFDSTVKMAKTIIKLSNVLNKEKFIIYCNDKMIKKEIENNIPFNVEIIDEYTSPLKIYKEAKLVLCRAGRNTVSELLYLGIPALLFASKGDFRSSEQEKNIELVHSISDGSIEKVLIEETEERLLKKINRVLKNKKEKNNFIPGNEIVLSYIKNMLENKEYDK